MRIRIIIQYFTDNIVIPFAKFDCCRVFKVINSNLDQGGKDKTFAAVHKIVGNGPEATIAGNLKKYFSSCGYTAKTRSASSYNAVKDAVRSGHPSALLLEGSTFLFNSQ